MLIFRFATKTKTSACLKHGHIFHSKLHAPTTEYLELCSHSASGLPPSRKLVVLDLNGTLLFRPKPGPHHGFERPVHLRPFMSTFRKYLLHQETRPWLDTMVWSSAQPHNVAIMVHSCFGREEEKLVQVWARDRMHLEEESYHRNVQTIKDLNTIWKYFGTQPSLQPFSVYDTVLVDDSMQKVALQPFNHICVKEYDLQMRRSDLATALISNHIPEPAASTSYDITLLALIGILEELKFVGNIAKWIKDGDIMPSISSDQQASLTWYENRTIMQYWAEKGRTAADRLEITIEADVKNNR
ncbi:hypothetical protein AX15_000532 [Amanita polypyramis BW_CC]|nr:hypothetical protein AX15_000532 [Amanita polypyramis BW_CC]